MQPVLIEQIPVGPMANFSYLIVDKTTHKAAYVDPGFDVQKVLQTVQKMGVTIEKILVTHTHFDHIQQLDQAFEALKVPVYVSGLEVGALEEMGVPAHSLADGDTVSVGGLSVKCLLTPGHTPGELCYQVGNHLITGDVLFVDGCGRVDLPGSDPEKMFHTLRMLAALPEETIIYPGHDYGPSPTDTIGNQKKTNPYLSAALKGEQTFFNVRGVF